MAATTITLRNTKGSPLTNTEMDTNISLLNSYSKGYLSKSISTSITLTDAEADNYFFAISGTLTSNVTITIPSILVKSWTVHNGTTGGFSITVKYTTGAGITVLNDTRATFYFDGTDMKSISYSNAVNISDTGTVTSTMILDGTIVNADINASAAIAITKLAASTISGVSLGSNLNTLTISSPLTGTSYNGSGAVSIGIPAATSAANGYMTAAYAGKVDGLSYGAIAEIGRYIDFHGTAGTVNDFDVRFDCGASGVSGQGTLSVTAGNVAFNSSITSPGFYGTSTSNFQGNQTVSTLQTSSGSLGAFMVQSLNSTSAAFISFHKPGNYASYFGLDNDNNFAVGGWSAGAGLGKMKVGSLGVGTAASGTSGEITATTFTGAWAYMPAGTRVPFAQAAAPTGWTQDVSDNAADRMLRVVNTAGGGVAGNHSPIVNSVVPNHTHAFSTGAVSADHTHNDNGHTHGYTRYSSLTQGGPNATPIWYGTSTAGVTATGYASLTGITANHSHSGTTDNGSSGTNWTPRYINMIICSKN